MPGSCGQGRGRGPRVQATRRRLRAPLLAAICLSSGCSHPLDAPVDLYHDLEGGEIAAQRPPPPGAGQPYPKLGSVPPKPTMPDPAYRRSLQTQLLAERDLTERVAADTPITIIPPPPPASPPPGAAAPNAASAPTANATLGAADAPPAAPPAKPAPPATIGTAPAAPADPTTLTLVGAPGAGFPDAAALPQIPPAPPPPASFEGVSPEPPPTPRIIPAHLAPMPAGTTLVFGNGDAVLPPSQIQALKDFLTHRKHETIEIIGLGEAASDTPDGQAAAIALGLARADAVAQALTAQHVPQSALRLGANAFGRGAVIRLLP